MPDNSDVYHDVSMYDNIKGFWHIDVYMMYIDMLSLRFGDDAVLMMPNINQVIVDDVLVLINPQ